MEVFSIIASREKVKVGIILGIFLVLAYSPIIFLDQSYYQLPAIPISEIGVSPDINIEEEDDDFSINTSSDNQLNYAIKLFSG